VDFHKFFFKTIVINMALNNTIIICIYATQYRADVNCEGVGVVEETAVFGVRHSSASKNRDTYVKVVTYIVKVSCKPAISIHRINVVNATTFELDYQATEQLVSLVFVKILSNTPEVDERNFIGYAVFPFADNWLGCDDGDFCGLIDSE